MKHSANCHHFVDTLGLKTLFAILMKKEKIKNKKGFNQAKDEGIFFPLLFFQ